MKKLVVGFAGMTHLGLVSASALAARGFEVVCFDADAALIERLRQRDWPVLEAGLDEVIRSNGERQRFTAARAELAACDLVYVALDVPTDAHGTSDLTGLTSLMHDVESSMAGDALLVLLSQVPPGYTRALTMAAAEQLDIGRHARLYAGHPRLSGVKDVDARDKPGHDAARPALSPERLYYQVETLVFGQALERALKPERIIIGCADPRTPIAARLRAVLDAFGCPVLPMRYESAELAKISINCCLVASITVANTLAEICEAIGADWAEIAPALKLDRRIGQYAYLSPGLGIAGGNLERDLATVQRLSHIHGTEAGLIAAMLGNSRYRRDWPLRQLQQRVLSRTAKARIGILGVTYKENTRSIKNSPAVALIRELTSCELAVYDPAVVPRPEWHPQMTVAETAIAACAGADAVAIMTPWPEFRAMAPADIAGGMRGRVVIDPYSMLDRAAAAAAGLEHVVLGAPLVNAE